MSIIVPLPRGDQACHGDVIIRPLQVHNMLRLMTIMTPRPRPQNGCVGLHGEVERDSCGSTADEDAMPGGSGWTGRGSQLQVGSGYCVKEFCDGQTLASRERWPVESRRHPKHPEWKRVADMITDFSQTFGTMKLLVNLAMGRIKDCPLLVEVVRSLKNRIIRELEDSGFFWHVMKKMGRIHWWISVLWIS